MAGSQNIMAVPIAILFYLSFPAILAIFILPIYILRLMAKLGKILLKNQFGNIVCPLSNLFGVDKVYEAPTANLILGSVYEGTITKELVCQVVAEKWLDKRDSIGRLFYPELRQGLANWLGFTFWENDIHFNVLNHVRALEVKGNTFTRGHLRTLMVNLVNSPFTKRRSPWEIVIIPNYINSDETGEITLNPQTLVLFKVHHSLIDGFSMLHLGEAVVEDSSVPHDRISGSSYEQYSFRSKFMAIIKIPYFLAKILVKTRHLTANIFSRREMIDRSRQVAFFNFNKIQLQHLKDIKAKYGVTLSSLLLTGFAAGLKSVFENNSELDIVTHNLCVIPVPLPGHPEKLRNHMSFAIIDLPMEESCPRKRLIRINESLNSARNSLDILTMFYVLKCMGSSPSWLVRLFVRNNPVPFLLTNFPGPPLPLVVNGHRCKELFFSGGLLDGHLHAICSCVGYEENVRIALSMDDYFSDSPNEIGEFLNKLLQELDMLRG